MPNFYRSTGFRLDPSFSHRKLSTIVTHKAGKGNKRITSMLWATDYLYNKKPYPDWIGFFKERRRHTLPHNCSTICAGGLNYSVRDGKR